MKNDQNVTKIAELPDSNGKTIICKKQEDGTTTYLFKTVWGDRETAWHEVGAAEAEHVITLCFGSDKAAELMAK